MACSLQIGTRLSFDSCAGASRKRWQRTVCCRSSLARPASELSVYEVVQAVDPISRILECPLKLPEHREELCALHRRLDDVMEMVEHSFRLTSVADLLKKPTFPKRLEVGKKASRKSPA